MWSNGKNGGNYNSLARMLSNNVRNITRIMYVMVMMTLDYIIIVKVELASKNGYSTYPYHMLW